MTRQQSRMAIIGSRNVGATDIYSLLTGGFVEELILIDRRGGKLLADVTDLRKVVPLAHPVPVHQGNFKDAAQADIVVIAAGASPKPNETRLDLLSRNVVIVRRIAAQLKRHKFGGIILLITNPVDVLAQVARDESGLPANRVIGSGTGLETMRRENLSKKLKIKNRSVCAGEETETASWCAARTGSAPLVDFCTPDCPDFGKMQIAIRRSPPPKRVRELSPFAAGSCVNRICEAILRDERTILPVTAMTGGEYGISGVYLNLPCVVGRAGIEKIVEFPISGDEKHQLLDCAASLYKTYKSLKGGEKCSIAAAK